MKKEKLKGVRLPECNDTPLAKELFDLFKSAYDVAGRIRHHPPKKVQPSRPRPRN